MATQMLIHMLLLLATGSFTELDAPKSEAIKQEWNKLEGIWTLIKLELGGKSLLEKDKPVPKVVFKDGKMIPEAKNAAGGDSMNIQLDPTRKPKTINVPNFKGGGPDE